jgi:hypothetical protein
MIARGTPMMRRAAFDFGGPRETAAGQACARARKEKQQDHRAATLVSEARRDFDETATDRG